MQITITIPDEAAAQMRSRGMAVETYLQGVVDEKLQDEERLRTERREAVEAMMRFAGERKLTLGGIDLKSMVHEGHKY